MTDQARKLSELDLTLEAMDQVNGGAIRNRDLPEFKAFQRGIMIYKLLNYERP